jgi:hypothetical protein
MHTFTGLLTLPSATWQCQHAKHGVHLGTACSSLCCHFAFNVCTCHPGILYYNAHTCAGGDSDQPPTLCSTAVVQTRHSAATRTTSVLPFTLSQPPGFLVGCPFCHHRWTLLRPVASAAAGLSRPRKQQQQKSSMDAAATASHVMRQGSTAACAAACGLSTSQTGWLHAAAAAAVCMRHATQRRRVRCRQQQLLRYDRISTLYVSYQVWCMAYVG